MFVLFFGGLFCFLGFFFNTYSKLCIIQIYELFDSLLTSLCHGCRRCLEDTVSVLLESIPAHQTPDNTRWLLFLEITRKKKVSRMILARV